MGLYPIRGAWMIYSIKKIKLNPYIIITILTLFTTFLEFLGLLSGRVFYTKGWNIFLTVFSYFVPYALTYFYYQYLKKLKILNH